LPYTEKDIIQNPAFRWEMETKSGQPLSPCVEINGRMLADVSGEEVEQYLIDNNLVQASDAATEVPTNAPCPTEQHEGVVKLNLSGVEALKSWSVTAISRFNGITG